MHSKKRKLTGVSSFLHDIFLFCLKVVDNRQADVQGFCLGGLAPIAVIMRFHISQGISRVEQLAEFSPPFSGNGSHLGALHLYHLAAFPAPVFDNVLGFPEKAVSRPGRAGLKGQSLLF